MSQKEQVRKHLEQYGSITSWEAITKYRITRLSGIIYILRHDEQMDISATDKRNEDGKNWVEYRLVKDGEQSALFESGGYKSPFEGGY
tara:strand:+ start:423 stop:686 length:264 start_codon:yes stop_codon:yes gene_type:complete